MSPATLMTLFALLFHAASAQVVTSAPTTAATDDGCANGLCDTTPYIRKLWMAHGILMLLGFVIIMPCAIGASLLRKYFPAGHVWFTVHRFLNWSAVIMMIIGFSIAVYIVSDMRRQPKLNTYCRNDQISHTFFFFSA